MNKQKLLFIIALTILPKISFTQDFPIIITANITNSSPEYILEINNEQREYFSFKFKNIKIGEIQKIKYHILIKNQNGKEIKIKDIEIKNNPIKNQNGTVSFMVDLKKQTINADFIPKTTGIFIGKTSLTIFL